MESPCLIPAYAIADIVESGISKAHFNKCQNDSSWYYPKRLDDEMCPFLFVDGNHMACRLWKVKSFRERFSNNKCSLVCPPDRKERLDHRECALELFSEI